MEEWQRKYITKNLPTLMKVTDFNDEVQAELLANDILSDTDVEAMDAVITGIGKSSAAYKFYKCLMTRVGAYEVLMETLDMCKQSGTAEILKNGLRTFGIPKKLEGFENMEIVVQGANRKLNDIFPVEKLEIARKIFQEAMPEVKFIDWFVKRRETFVLATSSMPPEPPIYIPRYISNRIEISEPLFKADCPDIFVFRNSINRWKLSEIATPYWTDSSTAQLNYITARFIHLDEYEDWTELKEKAKVPIHLINYDDDQKIYILEDSSGALEILNRIGSQKQRVYMSENEFIQQQLTENLKASSVCICDKPGMGKSYLLASITRVIFKQCNRTIIAFIPLSTFVADFTLSCQDPAKEQEIAILNVFKYVSPSPDHEKLLGKLVKAELLRMEIVFDGFDEIPSEKHVWMKKVFLRIKRDLPNVRIYITSRPHMRNELEKSLGVIAYDILPFNLENQVNYLVKFWSTKYPELDHSALKHYALNCVKEINETLSENDKDITGIPLLCRLIGEVYTKKVRFYVTTQAKNVDFPLKIAEMYQQFIQERIETTTQNEDDFIHMKLLHKFHALKLLFQREGFHNDKIFDRIRQLDASSEVLKAGIMHLESISKLEFIHRTFAEYFVAEYFSEKLQSTTEKLKADESKNQIFSILIRLLNTAEDGYLSYTRFVNSVIVSFVDFNLKEITISEETKSTVAAFCTSISPAKLHPILCSCCHHNLISLFVFLKEALRKWEQSRKNEYFTTKRCYELLGACIIESTSQMFHCCVQLFTEILGLDVEQLALYDKEDTLLHTSAKYGNYEALEYLMNRVSLELSGVLFCCVVDSSYESVDMIGRRQNMLQLLHTKRPTLINGTPYILAIPGIHVKLFKTLVKLGANLTAVDLSSRHNCVINATGHMSPIFFHEFVNFLLIDHKAEYLFLPNEKWKDPLPKIMENVELLPETLELLLNIPGIDINKKYRHGENLLFHAVEFNKLGNLEQLVNHGLDYNARSSYLNRSLLHCAVVIGNVQMVRYLLSLNLDPNSLDNDEHTPLHYAAKYSRYRLSVVKVLVENGANVQAKTDNGQTALHISAKKDEASYDEIKYLITNGVGVNDRDNEGNTPLHLCWRKQVKDCLIEMGADIHAKNKKGQTVLHTTASKRNASCDEIKYLIINGVDVNGRDNNGNTPLHSCEKKEVRECLVEMGADIHATNNNDRTPAQKYPDLWW